MLARYSQLWNEYIVIYCTGVDLALLSLADHSILSYGTFGVWGSLLAGRGETIIPKDAQKTGIGQQVAKAKIPDWSFY